MNALKITTSGHISNISAAHISYLGAVYWGFFVFVQNITYEGIDL